MHGPSFLYTEGYRLPKVLKLYSPIIVKLASLLTGRSLVGRISILVSTFVVDLMDVRDGYMLTSQCWALLGGAV